jgi:hypothetical protein
MPNHIHIIMAANYQFELGLAGRDLAAVGAERGVDCWGQKLQCNAR